MIAKISSIIASPIALLFPTKLIKLGTIHVESIREKTAATPYMIPIDPRPLIDSMTDELEYTVNPIAHEKKKYDMYSTLM